MSFNSKLLMVALAVIVLVALSVILTKKEESTYKPGISSDEDKAVAQAKLIYERKKEAEVDFSSGPCLTNDLMPGWVLDIAHNPREEIDNLVENQCQAYIEGRANHFVELDLEGNLIKVE